jgi:hypothetical protein
MSYRKAKETAEERGIPFHGFDCPGIWDVLSGKGPHISNNPVNVVFRKLMESRFVEHPDVTVVERKTAITWEIVKQTWRGGGHFLMKEKNWWTVADPETSREKVSVAFGDMQKL